MRRRVRGQIGFVLGAILLVAGVNGASNDDGSAAQRSQQPGARPPIVTGLDHFFATSPEPERLYRVFRDRFELPEVFPFRDYGPFASGVVSMGNVLFEVVTWDMPAGQRMPTELKGLAFEPAARLDETLARMKSAGVTFGPPDRVMMPDTSGQSTLAYINIPLDGPGGLPPADASIFINDNLGKETAAASRRKGRLEFERRRGGPLGVLSVHELVIGVEDPEGAVARWRKLAGDGVQGQESVVRWSTGPSMRFIKADRGAILEMVVRVRSLDVARRFLRTGGMLSESGSAVFIAPAAVDGLRIRLVE